MASKASCPAPAKPEIRMEIEGIAMDFMTNDYQDGKVNARGIRDSFRYEYGLSPSDRWGKLAPRFYRPFEIVEKVGPVAYRLDLPEELNGVHDTFHA
ncbi:hypothetical protein Tco_0429138 [Tanacetum coccineum]